MSYYCEAGNVRAYLRCEKQCEGCAEVENAMPIREVVTRLKALAEHSRPEKLSKAKDAAWRKACREGAAVLQAIADHIERCK